MSAERLIDALALVRAGLTEDEVRTLADSEQCDDCGHLMAMHNFHCCFFCKVDGCKCRDAA